MNLLDEFLIWSSKQATCSNSTCPVPLSVRRKKCTLHQMAGDIQVSTFDIIDPTFLSDKNVQHKLITEHCVKIVSQISGWEGANYNKRTGNIDRF